MAKWLGWVVANLLIVVLIWQKVQWQNEEEGLQSELYSLQERTLTLEQSIADLHVQLDEIEELGLKHNLSDGQKSTQQQESRSNHFSSVLGKLKKGVKQLKEKASELNRDLHNKGQKPKAQKPKEHSVVNDELI